MVSVLAFDLGGVLFTDGTREFIEYLHTAFGVDMARAGELLNGALGSGYREGKLTRNEFWSAFRRALELSACRDDLEAAAERRYRFLRLFLGGVFSHGVGVRKPNPRIYKLLLERTQAEARQILFVDEKDWALAPAAELGMKTVLFRDSEQVRHELGRLGVLPNRRVG